MTFNSVPLDLQSYSYQTQKVNLFSFSFHFLAWSKKLAKKSRLRIRFPLQIGFINLNQSSSKGFSSAFETRCLAQELLALLSINSFQFALKNNSYYVDPIQFITFFYEFLIWLAVWFWKLPFRAPKHSAGFTILQIPNPRGVYCFFLFCHFLAYSSKNRKTSLQLRTSKNEKRKTKN